MFTFIDLFSGIGGMRLAFSQVGGTCVFSSEINEYCKQSYDENFGDSPHDDITKIRISDIPKHDFLLAGFPCQPFSLAGTKMGFDDSRGDLFYYIIKIIKQKQPSVVFLENVKHLARHDNGRTFQIILHTPEKCGYHTHYKIISSSGLVPQQRERLYIVAFKNDVDFTFPKIPDKHPKLKYILETNVPDKYTLPNGTWRSLKRHKKKHENKGNGFGYTVADLNGISRTLSARYYKDGAEILIPQKDKNPRKLTPRECARLMGFPESFKINKSDNQAYRQFGNSVVVPIVSLIAKQIVKKCFPLLKNY